MTACSFAVSAHVCWNSAVRAARTAIPLFILGHTLSTCRSLDTRRPGSIRRRGGGVGFVCSRILPYFPEGVQRSCAIACETAETVNYSPAALHMESALAIGKE